MPSATTRSSPSSLLYYLREHKVLICKECRYAIQPSAISRHLKDLHRVYRSDRQKLVEYAKELQLADPGDVVPPSPDSGPVASLPSEKGLACKVEGCLHLCITAKRMKSHWAAAHQGTRGSGGRWRQVTLQTFFRGNQLRYFIVSGHSSPANKPEQCPDTDSKAPSISMNQNWVTPSQSPSFLSEPVLPSDWNADDGSLLNHFIQYTYRDMDEDADCRRAWKIYVPKISLRHDFLMHGILACSALHLSHIQPHNRRHYQLKAACHQACALPQFRLTIASPTEENCNAILAFSRLLIISCFASEEQDEDLLLVKGIYDSGLPDWLQVVRGSCTIFEGLWEYIQGGELSPLIPRHVHEENISLSLIPENPVNPIQLKELLALSSLGKFPFVEKGVGNENIRTYSEALMLLCGAFSVAADAKERGVYTIWMAVYIWPAKISLKYLELLKAREPAALLLLAHYCVLLGSLEEIWFVNGIRKRLLNRIYGQLNEEWRPWLEWPFREAGMEFPGVRGDL